VTLDPPKAAVTALVTGVATAVVVILNVAEVDPAWT
jgi:hypothetical protein